MMWIGSPLHIIASHIMRRQLQDLCIMLAPAKWSYAGVRAGSACCANTANLNASTVQHLTRPVHDGFH